MPFMKPYMVKLLREQFPPGTRIRLDSMMNDPQPIPKGMTGTVQGIDDAGQLLMEWDNGRGLSLVPGEDDFTVVKPQKLKLYMPLRSVIMKKMTGAIMRMRNSRFPTTTLLAMRIPSPVHWNVNQSFWTRRAASWNTITEATALTQRCSRSISKLKPETASSGAWPSVWSLAN